VKVHAHLRIELGELKPCWDKWCAQRGLRPQEAARQLMLDALRGDVSLHDPVVGAAMGPPDIEERQDFRIRLTPTERSAVRLRASASGFSGNRWVVALIRAHLANEPQFEEAELQVVAASNQQLAGLVRLLAGHARACEQEAGSEQTSRRDAVVSRQQFEELKQTLDAHLRAVAALIRANLDRWSL
jgi:hypothetical protein